MNLALDTAKYYGVSNQKAKMYINDAIKLANDEKQNAAASLFGGFGGFGGVN